MTAPEDGTDLQDESRLGVSLREYAEGVHPDLDALAASARVTGARIRQRRRLGGSVAAATAVAAVIGVASLGAMFGQHTEGRAPAFSDQPSPPAPVLAEGQVVRLAHGVTATVHRCHSPGAAATGCAMRGVSAPVTTTARGGIGSGFGAVLSEPLANRSVELTVLDQLSRRYPGIAVALHRADGASASNHFYRGQDVTVHLDGWTQVGPVADDKQSLQGPQGAVADIVWRAAADHDAWAGDPDKGKVPGVWTSAVHDGVFVSIQGGQGTTVADIQALGASLTWD